jgi:hypothetical protein
MFQVSSDSFFVRLCFGHATRMPRHTPSVHQQIRQSNASDSGGNEAVGTRRTARLPPKILSILFILSKILRILCLLRFS